MTTLEKGNKHNVYSCIHLLEYISRYLHLFHKNVDQYREWKDVVYPMDYLTDKMEVMKRLLDQFWHEKFWYVASRLREKDVKTYFNHNQDLWAQK